MFPRAPEFTDHGIDRDKIARAKGSDIGSTQSSSRLPPQTHQIMDAFLCWNTTNNATKYEQKKREEVQLRILSRLKRSAAKPHEEMRALVPSHHQKRSARGACSSSASAPEGNMGSRKPHEEMRTLVPPNHQNRSARGVRSSSASAPGGNIGSRKPHEEMRTLVPSHHQKRSARGVRSSSASAPGGNMGSRNGNGNNKLSGNSHTNHHPEDSSIIRSVMSLPYQKGGRISGSMGSPSGNGDNTNNVGFHTKYRFHLEDSSVTDRSITSSTHRDSSMSDSFRNENPSNNTRPTVPYRKAKNHGNQFSHGQNTHPPTYQPMNIPIDEEEEDIVCCDGGHCHEGTKNLW